MYRNSTLYSTVADYAASTFYMWDTKQVQFCHNVIGWCHNIDGIADNFYEAG